MEDQFTWKDEVREYETNRRRVHNDFSPIWKTPSRGKTRSASTRPIAEESIMTSLPSGTFTWKDEFREYETNRRSTSSRYMLNITKSPVGLCLSQATLAFAFSRCMLIVVKSWMTLRIPHNQTCCQTRLVEAKDRTCEFILEVEERGRVYAWQPILFEAQQDKDDV
jgi:hypothetical protein